MVVVISLGTNYFDKTLIQALAKTADRLEAIRSVRKINSPLHAKIILRDHQGNLHNIPFKQALDDGLLSFEQYPDALRNSPYWQRLISDSGDTIVIKIHVDTDPDSDNTDSRRQTFLSATAILSESTYFSNYGFAGEAELNHRIDYLSEQDLYRLVPIALLVLFLLLLAFYRNLAYVLITSLVILCTLLLTFNVNHQLGFSFNVVSTGLPILIMTIAIADSVHILKRWQVQSLSADAQAAPGKVTTLLGLCWQETWQPCFFTSLTSAVGFGVFYISELIPLSEFGITAFISILLAYPAIMLMTFALLYSLQPRAKKSITAHLSTQMWRVPFRAATDKTSKVLTICLVLLVVAIGTLPFATYETNFLDVFFAQQSATRKTFDLIDTQLSGSGGVDVILQGSAANTFNRIANFHKIKQQVAAASAIDAIVSASSLLEPVQMVHKPLSGTDDALPDTDEGLAQELLFLEFSRTDEETDVLSTFTDFDYRNTRIGLYTKNMKSSETARLIQELSKHLDRLSLPYLLTGASVYFHELSAYVLKTQYLSMSITGGLVWLLFIMQFGFKLGSIGIVSSVFPIALTLGLQIMLGIPFDFSTVLVASICLGLCIDDTIHYLHRFKYQELSVLPSSRLEATSAHLWQPIVVTSVMLIGGFLTLLDSDLVVVKRFAGLTAIAITLSLAACFLLLPALLKQFGSTYPNDATNTGKTA